MNMLKSKSMDLPLQYTSIQMHPIPPKKRLNLKKYQNT